MRVRLVDIGKEEMFHPEEVFELPEVFAKVSAFSFSVCLALNPGQLLDSDKTLETMGDLLQNVKNIYIKKRGEVEDNSISVEISWTEKFSDGPMSPLYTREVFLSDELAKKGILISDCSNNNEEEDDEEVLIRAVEDVKAAEETLPPNMLTVEVGSVLDCCVQSLVYWNTVVVHLNNSATRHALAQICYCMENFASTFPRVDNPR